MTILSRLHFTNQGDLLMLFDRVFLEPLDSLGVYIISL